MYIILVNPSGSQQPQIFNLNIAVCAVGLFDIYDEPVYSVSGDCCCPSEFQRWFYSYGLQYVWQGKISFVFVKFFGLGTILYALSIPFLYFCSISVKTLTNGRCIMRSSQRAKVGLSFFHNISRLDRVSTIHKYCLKDLDS